MPNDQMPNLFIIGAAKCGTTSLHTYLDLHPEISMSSIKEPRYFCRDVPGFELPVVANRTEYLGLFEMGTGYRGEASPAYSQSGPFPGVSAAIRDEVSDPRFIYLVRDPVDRIPSAAVQRFVSRHGFHREQTGRLGGLDTESLTAIVGDIEDPTNWIVDAGRYMTQIRAYLEHFPKDSILVVDSDELRAERRQTMERIFDFLGLEPVFDPEAMAIEFNTASEKVRESKLYVRLSALTAIRRGAYLLPDRMREALVMRVRRATGDPVSKPPLEPRLKKRLEAHYRPEVDALREFTGQEFPRWSI